MYHIEKAEIIDLAEILTLQKLAYLSEAELNQDFAIPPLTETHEQIREAYDHGIILKAVEDKSLRIIGAVRGRTKENTVYIGRLIVHPELQNQGIGKQLIRQMESSFPGYRFELFTSLRSVKNLALYQKEGYLPFKKDRLTDKVELIYLEKYQTKV